MRNLFTEIELMISVKMAQEIEVELRKIAPVERVIPQGDWIEVMCANRETANAFRDQCVLVAQLLEKYWFDRANIHWPNANKWKYPIPVWLLECDEAQADRAKEILKKVELELIKIADFKTIELQCDVITIRCFDENAAIKFRDNWRSVSKIAHKHQIKSTRIFSPDFDSPFDIPGMPSKS